MPLQAQYLGKGDLHDHKYNTTNVTIELEDFLFPSITRKTPGHCIFSITVYSSGVFYATSTTSTPVLFAFMVALIFFMVAMMFILYDVFVQKRNSIVIDSAVRATAVLASLFPKSVRDRMFKEKMEEEQLTKKCNLTAKSHLKDYLQVNDGKHHQHHSHDVRVQDENPIADLYVTQRFVPRTLAGLVPLTWTTVELFFTDSPKRPYSMPTSLDSRLGVRSESRPKFLLCSSPFSRLSMSLQSVETSTK